MDDLNYFVIGTVILFIVGIGGLLFVQNWYFEYQADIISTENKEITIHSIVSPYSIMTNDKETLYVDNYCRGRLTIDETYNVTISTRRIGDKWITDCEDC